MKFGRPRELWTLLVTCKCQRQLLVPPTHRQHPCMTTCTLAGSTRIRSTHGRCFRLPIPLRRYSSVVLNNRNSAPKRSLMRTPTNLPLSFATFVHTSPSTRVASSMYMYSLEER